VFRCNYVLNEGGFFFHATIEAIMVTCYAASAIMCDCYLMPEMFFAKTMKSSVVIS
jgi:hypothetical protein